MKRILIITLPQGTNYGGMLQAYSLQFTLAELGYHVDTTWTKGPLPRRIGKLIPGLQKAITILRNNRPIHAKNEKTTTLYTRKFVSEHLNIVGFDKAYLYALRGRYKAYISGSDQVWRKKYTYVPHNLFSFVHKSSKKISYAASFGRDDFDEYSNQLATKTKRLAQRFAAISVREDTGVGIAKKYWGVTALHHVDPTLLLNVENYIKLVNSETLPLKRSDGAIFSYVLDPAKDKQELVDIVAKFMDLSTFTIIDRDENNGRPMPPVTQWIKSFIDAEYIVTDSFHGTVFAIIFNKPFIAIGNRSRGLARFTSLLNLFGLEERLVLDKSELTYELVRRSIDWKSVNSIKAREYKRSLKYLTKHLSELG